jgi:hypothetical protein
MSDDFAVTVKDALREIRYEARKKVRLLDRGQVALQSLLLGTDTALDDDRPGRFSELSRSLANPVESIAQWLCETRGVAMLDDNFLLPVSASLGALAVDETDRLFAASFYRGGSCCLDKMGLSNVFMSEQSILRAARPVARRHAEWLKRSAGQAMGDDGRKIFIVADVTQAIIAMQPIKRVDRGIKAAVAITLALADLNAHCFLSVGIATAVVSVSEIAQDVSVADIMESAELVAAARYDRFAAALKETNPAAALAREFAAVVPYLP